MGCVMLLLLAATLGSVFLAAWIEFLFYEHWQNKVYRLNMEAAQKFGYSSKEYHAYVKQHFVPYKSWVRQDNESFSWRFYQERRQEYNKRRKGSS